MATTTRDDRMALFTKHQDPATQPEFWARVADNVDWTVNGTDRLAGRYHSKAEFIGSTFARLAGVLPGGVKLEITHLYIDAIRRSLSFTQRRRPMRERRSPMTIVGPPASKTTSSSMYRRTWIR